jgi:nucleoside-diphosphate-sugar epimerase
VLWRDAGIIADLLKDAANGLVRVIGEGKNHWPCVYARDLAMPICGLPRTPPSGVFHANDEADESVADIVESIAATPECGPMFGTCRSLKRAKMGAYADALALDQRVRSPRTRALGWSPTLHSVSGNVRAAAGRVQDETRGGVGSALSEAFPLTAPRQFRLIKP